MFAKAMNLYCCFYNFLDWLHLKRWFNWCDSWLVSFVTTMPFRQSVGRRVRAVLRITTVDKHFDVVFNEFIQIAELSLSSDNCFVLLITFLGSIGFDVVFGQILWFLSSFWLLFKPMFDFICLLITGSSFDNIFESII